MSTPRSNDYMHMGSVMRSADRKLYSYICNAAYYLRQAQEYLDDYKELANVSYYKGLREDWPAMARLNKQLASAEMEAASSFVSDLEDVGLLDYGDWLTINHTLEWFGVPAEDRYD